MKLVASSHAYLPHPSLSSPRDVVHGELQFALRVLVIRRLGLPPYPPDRSENTNGDSVRLGRRILDVFKRLADRHSSLAVSRLLTLSHLCAAPFLPHHPMLPPRAEQIDRAASTTSWSPAAVEPPPAIISLFFDAVYSHQRGPEAPVAGPEATKGSIAVRRVCGGLKKYTTRCGVAGRHVSEVVLPLCQHLNRFFSRRDIFSRAVNRRKSEDIKDHRRIVVSLRETLVVRNWLPASVPMPKPVSPTRRLDRLASA